MADFCRQCSIETFGEDYGDLAGITSEKDWAESKANLVLCEGCGATQVDPHGNCVSDDCIEKHGLVYWQKPVGLPGWPRWVLFLVVAGAAVGWVLLVWWFWPW